MNTILTGCVINLDGLEKTHNLKDARLVKLASSPKSKKRFEEIKEHTLTPDGKLDKIGNVKRFDRDLDSGWTVKKQ